VTLGAADVAQTPRRRSQPNLEALRATWNELGSTDSLWARCGSLAGSPARHGRATGWPSPFAVREDVLSSFVKPRSVGSSGRLPRGPSVAIRGGRSANLEGGLRSLPTASSLRQTSSFSTAGAYRFACRLGALRSRHRPARFCCADDWFARSRCEFARRGIRPETARDATRSRPAARALPTTSGDRVGWTPPFEHARDWAAEALAAAKKLNLVA
jgi:hypothetical protein